MASKVQLTSIVTVISEGTVTSKRKWHKSDIGIGIGVDIGIGIGIGIGIYIDIDIDIYITLTLFFKTLKSWKSTGKIGAL